MAVEKYCDLDVWKKSMELCETVYKITSEFPKQEQYGLTSQLRRCSVSIPSNIAEGFVRRHGKEFKHFLSIALSSLAELETQIILAFRLGYLQDVQNKQILENTDHIGRMMTRLYQTIE
ncbi:MAG: four helix bundle protein [Deltaproteobacteria bacterium]|nr:four helix bundle protein [Deltaproteobacteria bacterium]